MLQFCSNTWSGLYEWKNETIERSENLRFYTQDRAVHKGVHISIISSIAAAYLFNAAPLAVGAVFGAVNYITLTSLLEITRSQYNIDKPAALAIIGASSAITGAFIHTICKTSISVQAILILSAAAFAGQIMRNHCIEKSSF